MGPGAPYFAMMGVPLVNGPEFTARDAAAAPKIAILIWQPVAEPARPLHWSGLKKPRRRRINHLHRLLRSDGAVSVFWHGLLD